MSQENVEIVRRMYEAFGKQGVNEPTVLALIEAGVVDPDGEADLTFAFPDGGVVRLEGMGAFFDSLPWGRSSVREGGSRLCFVRDPDGYRIELIESHSR